MSVLNGSLPSEETYTAFSVLPAQFPHTDEKIKTEEFLDASKGVVTIINRFGKVFSPVVYDMNRNIEKISIHFLTDKEQYEYIEDMLLREQQTEQAVVVEALQWLRRGLHFITRFFQSIIENDEGEHPVEDLTPFFKRAYSETLEQHHGWLGTQLFNVMSRFAPTKHGLFFTLALDKHNKEEHVIRDMRQFTQRMAACVEKLIKFYVENGLENQDRA